MLLRVLIGDWHFIFHALDLQLQIVFYRAAVIKIDVVDDDQSGEVHDHVDVEIFISC